MAANRYQNLWWKRLKEKPDAAVLVMLVIVMLISPVLVYVKIHKGLWIVLALICAISCSLSVLLQRTSIFVVGCISGAFIAKQYVPVLGVGFHLGPFLLGMQFCFVLIRICSVLDTMFPNPTKLDPPAPSAAQSWIRRMN